ncbi:uncharacterized protein BT62DRAFT_694541 [Guyanagaster necrorhizus]|uniref:Secreted protein n=1 Tax=Guyanagaster necrorhizus TaxID=856835 RepID=A0A9P7VFL6_9AGAR|nr:uncharacterized protein BT62DRAFT_694541 [Guyanagaster necrorhizus MCA 3950]KAG7439677.1 hypothetical protein BT62DRAFT_694541 [Guyanagaster necrorhizus MCA 3950]
MMIWFLLRILYGPSDADISTDGRTTCSAKGLMRSGVASRAMNKTKIESLDSLWVGSSGSMTTAPDHSYSQPCWEYRCRSQLHDIPDRRLLCGHLCHTSLSLYSFLEGQGNTL